MGTNTTVPGGAKVCVYRLNVRGDKTGDWVQVAIHPSRFAEFIQDVKWSWQRHDGIFRLLKDNEPSWELPIVARTDGKICNTPFRDEIDAGGYCGHPLGHVYLIPHRYYDGQQRPWYRHINKPNS
jgi:hypothetical protein